MGFADVPKLYLEKTDCTAKELSAASGISASALSRYRSGQRIPDQEQMENSFEDLFSWQGRRPWNWMKLPFERLFQPMRASRSMNIRPS